MMLSLSKMCEHHPKFNERVDMKFRVFKQRVGYIEMIKFHQSLRKVRQPSKYRNVADYPTFTKWLYTNAWIHTNKLNTGNRMDKWCTAGKNK